MNPAQKKLLYGLAFIVVMVALYVLVKPSTDPRHNDWQTYFGDLGEDRNVDTLTQNANDKSTEWQGELNKYQMERAKGLPETFKIVNGELEKRMVNHKNLLDRLKKEHAQTQETLSEQVAQLRADDALPDGERIAREKELKTAAEESLQPHYKALTDDSAQTTEYLKNLHAGLSGEGYIKLDGQDKPWNYAEWVTKEKKRFQNTVPEECQTALDKAKSKIAEYEASLDKAKSKIAEYEASNSLTADWIELRAKVNDSLDNIVACGNRATELEATLNKLIHRDFAMWMEYGKMPQVKGFPLKEVPGEPAEKMLARIDKRFNTQAKTGKKGKEAAPMRPYSYQLHDMDEEARAYCSLDVQKVPEPPFAADQADYVFMAQHDLQDVLQNLVQAWGKAEGTGDKVRSDLFKGNYYVQLNVNGKPQKVIVSKPDSLARLGQTRTPALSMSLGKADNSDKNNLVGYDALVFLSPEQKMVVSPTRFPDLARTYVQGTRDFINSLGANSRLAFLAIDDQQAEAKQAADDTAREISLLPYHRTGAKERERLASVTVNEAIARRTQSGGRETVTPRYFKPTDDNIRRGYYPLIQRVYLNTNEHSDSTVDKFVKWAARKDEGQSVIDQAGLVALYPRPGGPTVLPIDDEIEVDKLIAALKTLDKNAFGYADNAATVIGMPLSYRVLFRTNEGGNMEQPAKKSGQAFVSDEKGADFDGMKNSLKDDIGKYNGDFEGACCVVFIGHADSTGQDGVNNRLSAQRAATLMSHLTGDKAAQQTDFSKARLTLSSVTGDGGSLPCVSFGSGSRIPTGDNNTEQGKAENRRAEAYLIWKPNTRVVK